MSALTSGAGTLGIPGTTTTNFFDRVTTASAITLAGSTLNGAGVVNGGLAPVWIVDATSHSFVGYDPGSGAFGTNTGFQTLFSTGAPAAGTIEYSRRVTVATAESFTADGLGTQFAGGSAVVDVVNGAGVQTLTGNPSVYALRMAHSINAGTEGRNHTLRICA